MREIKIDLQDYKEGGSVFRRVAVRGIIERDGKYLIIHSKYGDYKFPGGGMEQGETLEQTLEREIKEETGYQLKLDSVGEVILVHEKRKGNPEDILEMDSYYYYCDVEQEASEQNLDDYEKEYDYQVEWLPIQDIIKRNQSVSEKEMVPWVERETMVMKEVAKMSHGKELFDHIDNIHTTDLGIQRVKKNIKLTNEDVVRWCRDKMRAQGAVIYRKGKNWYVETDGVKITINAYSYTIITAHIMQK